MVELAAELSEFGYRETNDSDEADRRRFYKVERWDGAEQHVLELLYASILRQRDIPTMRIDQVRQRCIPDKVGTTRNGARPGGRSVRECRPHRKRAPPSWRAVCPPP
jgi:hypothetical protein